jgi:tRNA threonylcarbamoyladenosine biosynthesis protein TsaE
MPILDRDALEFISRSADQTRRVGIRLGALLQPGDVIHLIGDLGAGKTTFVQGMTRGWGSVDSATSPTFVLVNVYQRAGGQRLYHLDAYRLSGTAEAIDLDLDLYLENGPLVVEWAERVRRALPDEYLQVRFNYVDTNQRDLMFTAHGARYQKMIDDLRQLVYGVHG